jgi:hypothetical protein
MTTADLQATCQRLGLHRIEQHVYGDGSGHFTVFGSTTAYAGCWHFATDGDALPTPETAMRRLEAHFEKGDV